MARLELTARFTVYISYANLLYPRLIRTFYRSLVREYSLRLRSLWKLFLFNIFSQHIFSINSHHCSLHYMIISGVI